MIDCLLWQCIFLKSCGFWTIGRTKVTCRCDFGLLLICRLTNIQYYRYLQPCLSKVVFERSAKTLWKALTYHCLLSHYSKYTLFAPLSLSQHPAYLSLSSFWHLGPLLIPLPCLMAHGSINHLFVHTSCTSIHYQSFPSCYHLPLLRFSNSSSNVLSNHSSISQFLHVSINPHSHTHFYVYSHTPPSLGSLSQSNGFYSKT